MFCVVAYDIPDNRRRGRLFKIMKGYGIHTQFSVFECEFPERSYKKMVSDIKRTIKTAEDNIKIYILCSDCVKSVGLIGTASMIRRPECIII